MVPSAVGIILNGPEVSIPLAAVHNHRRHVRAAVQVVAVAQVGAHRQTVGRVHHQQQTKLVGVAILGSMPYNLNNTHTVDALQACLDWHPTSLPPTSLHCHGPT